VQVGQSVAVDLDQRAHMLRHGSIGIHVEQDGAGIADEAVRPGGDDDGAAQTHNRVSAPWILEPRLQSFT
jgi:hypothetical protein